MAEPATSGTTAATVATALSAGSVGLISLVNNPTVTDYLVGTLFTIIGAVGWQFVVAQTAREQAAQKGIAKADRPTVDFVTIGYAAFACPMVAGAIIAMVHFFGGKVGVLSLPGFIVGGAAGPTISQRAVSLLLAFLPSQKGGS